MVSIIICAIFGITLTILQIMSIIGNMKTGGLNFFSNATNFGGFLYDLISFFGYFLVGIIGLFFLIVAIKGYRELKQGKNKKTTTDETDSKENENKE